MAVKAALVTLRVAVPVTLPEAALMVVVPAATPLASPAAEIVAAAGLLLDPVTVGVQSELVPLE